MTGTGEEHQPKVEESHAQVPSASASSSDPQAPEVDQQKWGTHIMGPPAVPTCHPDNQKAALWRAEDQREEFHPQPYVVYSPIDKPSNNPLESVVNMFNSWSNRAETIARNIWHNCKFHLILTVPFFSVVAQLIPLFEFTTTFDSNYIWTC